jgi:hypothetical protein
MFLHLPWVVLGELQVFRDLQGRRTFFSARR